MKKICGNGIKKLIVHKKTLIIFDCDHNIELYDIISTENESISFSNMADNETWVTIVGVIINFLINNNTSNI